MLKYKFHFTTVIAQQNQRRAGVLALFTMRREHDDHRKLYWRENRYQQQRNDAVYDPATGKAVREVTVSTAQEVSEAIQVARDALTAGPRTTPLRRARVLFTNFKMLLEQHVEELAGIIVSEHGKGGRMRWAS